MVVPITKYTEAIPLKEEGLDGIGRVKHAFDLKLYFTLL